MTIEIVLLAMVAAFLGLRLYSVLGKRTGHEQEPPAPRTVDERRPVEETPQTPDAPIAQPRPELVYAPGAEAGIRALLAADRNFDVARFLEGAKAAYGMILDAFWKGDRDELATLCDDDVLESFVAAIEEREERGEVLENRLVRIEEARIVDAEYDRPLARVTIQFDADVAAVTKDSEGNVIAGSLTDAIETHNVWTFSRDLTSDDPNWVLDETDEA